MAVIGFGLARSPTQTSPIPSAPAYELTAFARAHRPLLHCSGPGARDRCALWSDPGYDFSSNAQPDAASVLRDAEVVMIPVFVQGRGWCQETVNVMYQILGREYSNSFYYGVPKCRLDTSPPHLSSASCALAMGTTIPSRR